MKHLLFQKVKCNGYLKKFNDGRFIESIKNKDGTYDCNYIDYNNSSLNIECEQCGELDFLKTYFVRKEKEFIGMIVGFKHIVVTGYLTVETEYDHVGREYTRFGKQVKEAYDCAIVYYGNNRKRYVPLENILSD